MIWSSCPTVTALPSGAVGSQKKSNTCACADLPQRSASALLIGRSAHGTFSTSVPLAGTGLPSLATAPFLGVMVAVLSCMRAEGLNRRSPRHGTTP